MAEETETSMRLACNPSTGSAGAITSLQPRGAAVESLVRARIAAAAIDLLLLVIGLFTFVPLHWVWFVLFVAAFLIRDCGDHSPGKRILKLHVRAVSGSCTLRRSVIRNLTLLPPALFVEVALLLFGDDARRFGDKLAGTQVEPLSSQAQPKPAKKQTAPSATDPVSATADASKDPTATDMVLTEAVGTLSEDAANPWAEPADADATAGSSCTSATLDLKLAAHCIGIDGEVSYDTLDDAYWQYVERYSPDAAEKLTDAELLARCTELAARKAEPAIRQPRPLGPAPSREQCLHFLNEWLVIINKCRDALG